MLPSLWNSTNSYFYNSLSLYFSLRPEWRVLASILFKSHFLFLFRLNCSRVLRKSSFFVVLDFPFISTRVSNDCLALFLSIWLQQLTQHWIMTYIHTNIIFLVTTNSITFQNQIPKSGNQKVSHFQTLEKPKEVLFLCTLCKIYICLQISFKSVAILPLYPSTLINTYIAAGTYYCTYSPLWC